MVLTLAQSCARTARSICRCSCCLVLRNTVSSTILPSAVHQYVIRAATSQPDPQLPDRSFQVVGPGVASRGPLVRVRSHAGAVLLLLTPGQITGHPARMLPSCDMILIGALRQQGAGYEGYFDLVTASNVPNIRTLASQRFRGAKLGANDHSYQATPGHFQPLGLRRNGTSGHIQHYQGTFRKCLLSSRSRVRVAVGAQMMQVILHIRNYNRSIDVLLASNHSI